LYRGDGTRNLHPNWKEGRHAQLVKGVEDGTLLLLDEVHRAADSHEMKRPQNRLWSDISTNVRKMRNRIIWTSQRAMNVDIRIRDITTPFLEPEFSNNGHPSLSVTEYETWGDYENDRPLSNTYRQAFWVGSQGGYSVREWEEPVQEVIDLSELYAGLYYDTREMVNYFDPFQPEAKMVEVQEWAKKHDRNIPSSQAGFRHFLAYYCASTGDVLTGDDRTALEYLRMQKDAHDS